MKTYSGLKANVTLPDDHHWHMIHFFSYLRQTILCSADTALVGLETTFPDHNGGSDGWDSKHGRSACLEVETKDGVDADFLYSVQGLLPS